MFSAFMGSKNKNVEMCIKGFSYMVIITDQINCPLMKISGHFYQKKSQV